MFTTATLREPRARSWMFLFTALVVIFVCIAVVRSSRYAAAPDLAAFGVTFDLCITVPLAYYLLVVRGGRARPFTLIPLFIACLFVARLVVPTGEQQMLRQLGILEGPVEIIALGALAIRARRAAIGSASADFPARFAAVIRGAFGDNRIADALIAETAILYFAIAGWRVPSPRDGFTFHKRSGWGSICACIAIMIVAEGIGAHLLIQRWSTTAAWIWTAFDAYAILWLIGDWQAFRLRPAAVAGGTLHLNFGLRWSTRIDLRDISSIKRLSAAEGEAVKRDRSTLRLAIFDSPALMLETSRPIVVEGLLGFRKEVTRIALLPDETDTFVRSLDAAAH